MRRTLELRLRRETICVRNQAASFLSADSKE
jgi:hypothetical protein